MDNDYRFLQDSKSLNPVFLVKEAINVKPMAGG
jgi:hypothetical protein